MTKKDLVKIIREVVRREVQKEVQKIFIKEETSSRLGDIIPEIKKSVPKVSSEKEVKYSKNQALNKVLNETVALSKKEPTEEYPTLGGGTFDTNRMTELLGYDTLQKAGKSIDDVPEHVTNALTRDYSGLMKAMNKKG